MENERALEKKAVRKQIREWKRRYAPEELASMSRSALRQVERDEAFRRAEVVLAYWSMADEVDTHEFVCRWAGRKTVLLPCVRGDELELRRFDSREALRFGERFAIPEPEGPVFADWDKIDFILVPGVAFDRANNRLGRGRGYYDRLLGRTKAYKMGICFAFQLLDAVPAEAHDIKMDKVVHSD